MASPNVIDGMKTEMLEKKKKKVLKREAAEKLLKAEPSKTADKAPEKKVRTVKEKREAMFGKDK